MVVPKANLLKMVEGLDFQGRIITLLQSSETLKGFFGDAVSGFCRFYLAIITGFVCSSEKDPIPKHPNTSCEGIWKNIYKKNTSGGIWICKVSFDDILLSNSKKH